MADNTTHLKNLLVFTHLREKRSKELSKLSSWLACEQIKIFNLQKEYRTNDLYKDPEIEPIVLMQIDLSIKVNNIVERKYKELARFIKNGDLLLKSCINDALLCSYPSTTEIEQMDNADIDNVPV